MKATNRVGQRVGVLLVPALLLTAIITSPARSAQQKAAGQSGSFVFAGSPAAKDRPIRVWYHIPEGLGKDARVIFTMHGSGGTTRPAKSTVDAWAPLADAHKFIVIAPEFSWAYYPTAADYHWGGMHTEDGKAVDASLWAYTTIALLFDDVRQRFGLTTPNYTMWGHSAGAQFVHRMHMFKPDPRVDLYISANPGNYTMPSLDWKYPYGLDKGDASSNRQTEQLIGPAFKRPFLLLLGAADTTRELSANNSAPGAMAQGAYRTERARKFWEVAQAEAKRRGLPFRWEFRDVPNVAHQNAGMAAGTVRALGW